MKQKAVLTGLFLLLVFSSLSFKCDGNSTPPDSPWRPAAKAADDIAISINTMIKTKRALAQQGTITPDEERMLTNALLKLNTADKVLVAKIKTVKSATEASANKPTFCSMFAAVAAALADVTNSVSVVTNPSAKTKLTTIINAFNASAATIATQCA